MKITDFKEIIKNYKQFSKKISELYDIGFDFYEGKYKLIEDVELIIDKIFEIHYEKEGIDWINWFIYDNNYGDKKLEAFDENKKPICYDIESLYEYIEKNHKK